MLIWSYTIVGNLVRLLRYHGSCHKLFCGITTDKWRSLWDMLNRLCESLHLNITMFYLGFEESHLALLLNPSTLTSAQMSQRRISCWTLNRCGLTFVTTTSTVHFRCRFFRIFSCRITISWMFYMIFDSWFHLWRNQNMSRWWKTTFNSLTRDKTVCYNWCERSHLCTKIGLFLICNFGNINCRGQYTRNIFTRDTSGCMRLNGNAQTEFFRLNTWRQYSIWSHEYLTIVGHDSCRRQRNLV
jgi:hypothetical protein